LHPQTTVSISEEVTTVDLLYLPVVFSLSSRSETAQKLVKFVYIQTILSQNHQTYKVSFDFS